MPTNCWNIDKAMPIQTIGNKPNRPPNNVAFLALASSEIALWMSRTAFSTSSAGQSLAKISCASASRPFCIR